MQKIDCRGGDQLNLRVFSVLLWVSFFGFNAVGCIQIDDLEDDAADQLVDTSNVYVGLYSYAPPSNIPLDLTSHNAWAGQKLTFNGQFHDVTHSKQTTFDLLEAAWKAESTPFANLIILQSASSLAAGQHDAAIRGWVQDVNAWLSSGQGRSLIIAPLPEGNLGFMPYAGAPGDYRAAYRRIVDIARSEGMNETQVRFAFAPNYAPSFGSYYPGDSYVDLMGVSTFNFGTGHSPFQWDGADGILAAAIANLKAVNPNIPWLFCQAGSSVQGGDREYWLERFFEVTSVNPNAVGLVWFNFDKETDWRVWNSDTGQGMSNQWRAQLQAPRTRHAWPLTHWFKPGPLPSTVEDPVSGGGGGGTGSDCAAGECDTIATVDSAPNFTLYSELSTSAQKAKFLFGNPGDLPLMGDWNCDGTPTPGMYRTNGNGGFMYLRYSNSTGNADESYFYGNPGDIPLAGDWNGDGCDTLSIYRPSEAKVYVKNTIGAGNADYSFYYGNGGDKPFVGDFDGDCVDSVGLHRESTGQVFLRNSNSTGNAEISFVFGDPGDQILAGDWNGDGKDTVAIYRRGAQAFFARNSNTSGTADFSLNVGAQDFVVPRRGLCKLSQPVELEDEEDVGEPVPPDETPGQPDEKDEPVVDQDDGDFYGGGCMTSAGGTPSIFFFILLLGFVVRRRTNAPKPDVAPGAVC